MPAGDVNSIYEWRRSSEIDYFSPFINAWLAFNAWMRSQSGEDTDRKMLDYVKNSQNRIKGAFVNLLQASDEESITFQSDLSSLHFQLERIQMPAGKHDGLARLSFTEMVLEENTERTFEYEYRGVRYTVERFTDNGRKGQVQSRMVSLTNRREQFRVHQDKYSLEELLLHQSYVKLSSNKQGNLRHCYQQINPRRPVSLLARENETNIAVGSYTFKPDLDLLFKGVIHALYCIRNGLFHGEIVPDKPTNELYGSAYRVLKKLIDHL